MKLLKTRNSTHNSEKKIPDATTLIHINQYKADKQDLEKLLLINKISDASGLVPTTVLNTEISKVENKIPNTSCLVTTTGLNTKISEEN